MDWFYQSSCVTGEDAEARGGSTQLAEDHMAGRARSRDVKPGGLVGEGGKGQTTARSERP